MRRSYGRDAGLSIRMAIALALVALVYLAAEALFIAMAVSAAMEGGEAWKGVPGFLMFAAAIPVLVLQQLRKSESLLLRTVRAKILDVDEEPRLQALVARVAAQADLPQPRVALIRSWAPNALTAARRPQTAVVAVTTELLRRLEWHELEAVVAHELAHVANRDGPVMTFVGGPAVLGSHLWRDPDGDWGGKFVYLFIYWPIHVVGLLLMWTVARYREYAADLGSVVITGAPENLISALLKIEGGAPPRADLRGGLAAQAFCIVPRQSRWRRFELVMDHPPMRKRIERLEELARELGKARA